MAGDIAERVRELIARSGLTQAEFAAKTGLDPSKMSKSLAGKRRFTSLDLARIADVGGASVDWLLGTATGMPSVAARSSAVSSSPTEEAVREAETLAQLRADLSYLGYSRQVVALGPVPTSGLCVEQGRRLAEKARDHAQRSGFDPWEKRDLADPLEEAFGVDVRIVRLPDGFDGLGWADEHCRLMVVNTSRVPARQRFTIAHELGHLLAGDDQGLHLDANLHDAGHRKRPTEMRANAFAAEFLLPEALLRAEAARLTWSEESFARLACRLWVTPVNLAWRLLGLELIDRRQFDVLGRMTAASAARLAGAMSVFAEWIASASRPRVPTSLVRTTYQAYADGKATLRPFANLLGVDTATLRQAISEPREDFPLTP
ncbi:helix-turn-helix domain-containing protein [Nonomuraea cavernae]|uniref:helix-turn-helix domain-containing protein n=1 Tax=Nonomuraea cavernae TaxID=2045107 RepID=UPI003405B1FC